MACAYCGGGAPADMTDGGNLRAQRSHPFRVGLRVPSDGPAALGFLLLLARIGGGAELVLALPGRRQPYRYAAFRGRLARTCRSVAYFRVPLAQRVVLRPDEGVDLALLALQFGIAATPGLGADTAAQLERAL